MKNKTLYGISTLCLFLFLACNENNTDVTNNNDPNSATNNPTSKDSTNSNETVQTSESENSTSKTDAEVMLDAGKFIISTGIDFSEKQRIKDSVNEAHKEKMYAYQIGLQYREQDAFDAYAKLIDSGVSNLYVFKVGRKEYYVIRFEAKGLEELEMSKEDFKSQLGDNGTEGLKVINLTDFCSKKETVIKHNETDKNREIKCLVCD
jgi:hypothetical protein